MHGGNPPLPTNDRRRKKSHPGQLKASRRKQANRALRQQELAAQAERLGITPNELRHRRIMEGKKILEEAAAANAARVRRFLDEDRDYRGNRSYHGFY